MRAWLMPGFLFGLTALIRPEYLLVGVAFGLYALIARLARPRPRGRRSRRRRCWRSPSCSRSCPGRSATRSSSTARSRSRPAAARRSTSAPTCPPTANTSGSRRCSPSATWTVTSSPAPRQLDAVDPKPLFDRVADRYPDLPRDEALGKIGKQNFYDYLEEDPFGYLGDDRAQGLADVERGHRRSDELDRRAGRPGPGRPAGARGAGRPRSAPQVVGSGRDGDPARPRHRRRRRIAGGPPPQRDADDTGLSACRRGPGESGRSPILQQPMAAHHLIPTAGIFPSELTALARGRLDRGHRR